MLRNVGTRSIALGGTSLRPRPSINGLQGSVTRFSQFNTVKSGFLALPMAMNSLPNQPRVRHISATKSRNVVKSDSEVTTTSSIRGVFTEIGETKKPPKDERNTRAAIRSDLVRDI